MYSSITDLISANDTHKTTIYFELSNQNLEKNRIKLKVATKGVEMSDKLNQYLENISSKSSKVSSIGLFIDDKQHLKGILPLFYAYSGEYKDKRYHLLPYFDYRNSLYENLLLVVISLKYVKVYEVSHTGVEELDSNEIISYEKFASIRQVNTRTQEHTSVTSRYHGQNASSDQENEDKIKSDYLKQVADEVKKISDEKSVLIVAGNRENIDIFTPFIKSEQIIAEIEGAINTDSTAELFESVDSVINENTQKTIDLLAEKLDINKSNELQDQSFVDILSVIYKSQISNLYIGKLDENDRNPESFISPLGANYIAQEVAKLGGEVKYYPHTNFPFSRNNLLFEFRF